MVQKNITVIVGESMIHKITVEFQNSTTQTVRPIRQYGEDNWAMIRASHAEHVR